MDINFTALPGEAAIVALANLFQALAPTDEAQKKEFTQRFLDVSAPWHALAVEASKNAAAIVQKLIQVPQPK